MEVFVPQKHLHNFGTLLKSEYTLMLHFALPSLAHFFLTSTCHIPMMYVDPWKSRQNRPMANEVKLETCFRTKLEMTGGSTCIYKWVHLFISKIGCMIQGNEVLSPSFSCALVLSALFKSCSNAASEPGWKY